MNEVFDEVCQLFKNEIKNRGLNFKTITKCFDELPGCSRRLQAGKILRWGIEELTIRADKDRIKQVLVNLISNSIKFWNGSVTIEWFKLIWPYGKKKLKVRFCITLGPSTSGGGEGIWRGEGSPPGSEFRLEHWPLDWETCAEVGVWARLIGTILILLKWYSSEWLMMAVGWAKTIKRSFSNCSEKSTRHTI